jgi:UDP-glucose 4-epimerase
MRELWVESCAEKEKIIYIMRIAEVSGKKIKEIKVLNPAVLIASKIPGKIGGLVNKAFGNMTYELDMSKYPDMDYQLVSLDESIIRTEGNTNGK